MMIEKHYQINSHGNKFSYFMHTTKDFKTEHEQKYSSDLVFGPHPLPQDNFYCKQDRNEVFPTRDDLKKSIIESQRQRINYEFKSNKQRSN